MGSVSRRGFMQILAGAAGAVVCLGPAALAASKSVEFGSWLGVTPTAWATGIDATMIMEHLRYIVMFDMGAHGYRAIPNTEEWYTKRADDGRRLSPIGYNVISMKVKGRLMTAAEKRDWWLHYTSEGAEYQYNKLREAQCGT